MLPGTKMIAGGLVSTLIGRLPRFFSIFIVISREVANLAANGNHCRRDCCCCLSFCLSASPCDVPVAIDEPVCR